MRWVGEEMSCSLGTLGMECVQHQLGMVSLWKTVLENEVFCHSPQELQLHQVKLRKK